MIKKLFALASVTGLSGLVAVAAAAGCSSTETVNGAAPDTGTGVDSGKKDGAGSSSGTSGTVSEVDTGTPVTQAEEKTVGKACKADTDCNVANSINDNLCSNKFFKGGDLLPTPVCVSQCAPNANPQTLGDLLCDGDAKDAPGFCFATSGGGICFPLCTYDSAKVTGCLGNNKCAIDTVFTSSTAEAGVAAGLAVGFCLGGCSVDADCQGTAGQKCDAISGLCFTAAPAVDAKKTGEACDDSKTGTAVDCQSCSSLGGTTANKDKGICTRSCVTGAAGDAACKAANGATTAGWKCTAQLPTKDDKGVQLLFTGQPDDVLGNCKLACTGDPDCAAYGTTAGTKAACQDYAGGKFCKLIE